MASQGHKLSLDTDAIEPIQETNDISKDGQIEDDEIFYRLGLDCEGQFDQIQSILAAQSAEDEDSSLVKLCSEFQERFSMWASHIGLFSRKSQCLDKRLQNHPDLHDLTTRSLDILRCALQKTIISINNEKESSNAVIQGTETTKGYLETIGNTLGKLNQLAINIRQSSRPKIEQRLPGLAEDTRVQSFSSLSLVMIQGLYPQTHPSLQQRLSDSMTHRYMRLLFGKERQQKLETRRDQTPVSAAPSTTPRTILSSSNISQAMMRSLTLKKLNIAPTLPSLSDLSSVDIQRIRARLRPADEPSIQSHRTRSIQVNQAIYPKPPATERESNIFKCEWCSETLDRRDLSDSNWRQHMDRDLKPYTCLSDTCSSTLNTSYPTLDQWITHMQIHKRQWYRHVYPTSTWICTVCINSKEIYNSPKDLYQHLYQHHSWQFSESEMQSISRQSKTEEPRLKNECLLCLFEVEEGPIQTGSISQKRPPNQQQQRSNKQARRSLASTNATHLESDDSSSESSSDSHEPQSQSQSPIVRSRPSTAMDRHIAAHLQVLMLITVRLIAIQHDDSNDIEENTDYASVDIHDDESTVLRNRDSKSSDSQSYLKNDDSNWETKADDDAIEEGIFIQEEDYYPLRIKEDTIGDIRPVPDMVETDLSYVPRQFDSLPVEEDTFLQKLIESGAYQSWPFQSAEEIAAITEPFTNAVYRAERDLRTKINGIAELKAGDLVRIISETPDGYVYWASLDDSQQGTAPRSFFSEDPIDSEYDRGGWPGTRAPIQGPIPRHDSRDQDNESTRATRGHYKSGMSQNKELEDDYKPQNEKKRGDSKRAEEMRERIRRDNEEIMNRDRVQFPRPREDS